jgi:hypothetical protein
MSLTDALKRKFPDAVVHPFSGDFQVQDDGDGPYIRSWNEAKLGKHPTAGEIAAIIAEHEAAPPPATRPPREKLQAMLDAHGLSVTDLKAALAEAK